MICFESTERANRNSSTLGDDEISELFAELPPQDCREGVPKDQQRGDCQGLGPKDLRGPYREHRLTDRGDSNQQRVQDSTYEVLQGEDERADEMDPEDNQADTHGLPGRRVFTLNRLIQKAREGVRHAQGKSPLRILKYSKANDEVMKAARNFKCTACERNSRVRPARRAAPPREININEVVGADVVWLPMPGGKTKPALNLIDWATHFQMMIPLQNKKPASLREAYRHWLRFFDHQPH